MLKKFKINERIDLRLSLYPSFASALFIQLDNETLLKDLGYGKGLKIRVRCNEVVCEGVLCDDELIKEWIGIWFNPYDYLDKVKRSRRWIIEKLINLYNGVRIITSSIDWKIILAAVFLSRRTDYHVNVVRWIKTIFKDTYIENTDTIIERIDVAGKSYQLKQLKLSIDSLFNVNFNEEPWILRRELLLRKYVGPKVVDAFLLFTKKGSVFTPSDIHYQRFVKNLNLVNRKLGIPMKNMCLRYGANCFDCPFRDNCLTGWSISVFGELSGWVQTIAYIHDKMFCSRKLCMKCGLRDLCMH